MPDVLQKYAVFIASPGGLQAEREAVRDLFTEYNQSEAIPRGALFEPVGWEDTFGGIGRPQGLINEDVRRCDYLLLMLRDRWGSAPGATGGAYSSGTEEEYNVALECFSDPDHRMNGIVMVFHSVDPARMVDPGPQLERVLDFKRQVEDEKAHLFHTVDSMREFRLLVRRHLGRWLRDHGDGPPGQRLGPQTPQPAGHADLPSTDVPAAPGTAPEGVKVAWSLADAGRLVEAEVEFSKAIIGGNDAYAIMEYGRFLARTGRLDQAMVYLMNAQVVAQRTGDDALLAAVYGNLGILLSSRSDLDGAEEMYRKSLEIDERLGRWEGLAADYSGLGHVRFARGDLHAAEEMYRRSLEIGQRLGREGALAVDYGNLANVLLSRGDLDGAEEMYRKSLEIDERLGRAAGVALSFGNLGGLLFRRGDLDGAEEMHRKALEINKRLGRLEAEAGNYGSLGSLACERGDLDGAEQMHRKALEINERLGRLEGMADNYGNLGIVLGERSDLDGAEEMIRRSLEIEERLGRLRGMASDYTNLGIVLSERGDLDGAEQMHRKALEISMRLGLPESMSSHYRNLGEVLNARGDLEGAKEMYQKALEQATALGRSDLVAEIRRLAPELPVPPAPQRDPT